MLEVRPIAFKMAPNGDRVVLGGNMRLRACREAGLVEIPAIDCSAMTEAQQREFIIKDNVGFGEWDWGLIQAQWPEAEEWGVEIPDKFKVMPEAGEDDYVIPEEVTTDIVVGDLFEIGPHRMVCGDSTEAGVVERVLNGNKADMLTDPPYGIDINMNMGRRKGQPKKFDDKTWDKSVPDFFYLLELFDKKIIWGGNYFSDRLPITKDWLCWYKKTSGLDFADFELAWSNVGQNARLIEHHWSGEVKLHPTMKPVSVILWCIGYLKSDILFDPFLGSGTTMVAAHQLNRKCYGIEIDPKYCQIIIDRMRNLDPSIVITKNGVAL
jgi:hypothetical protein